jgi:probable rRNA maturation factor
MSFIQLRPLGNFVTVTSMKLVISVHDTRIKSKTSKALVDEIIALEQSFLKFFRKNPHLKNVKLLSFHLTLCGKSKIKKLNSEFRGKNKITDVLSFGVHENLRPDKKIKMKLPNILELGDIFVCNDVALKQASEFEITFQQEVVHLVTHGLLHLLGFDHEISLKEEKIMESYEAILIKEIYKKLGYK